MPLAVPSAQVLLIVDAASASGGTVTSPSPQMAGWLLPIATGDTALQTAATFADSQQFPVGTKALVMDLSASPLAIQEFALTSQWAAT